ncbi:MAG: U32 family peptidase [Melioribacteraceae bacterium]|nr:MAG: U32 family peptidase [Melioribacteraceae bacterium]
MNSTRKKPELLAPAGNWTMLRTAVKAGADAVYFGTDKLNMRAKAKNFTLESLPEIAKFCKENNVDSHLTVNSIVFENDLKELDEVILAAKKAGIDLIICWDMSVIQKCIEHEMPFCISTQASISNSAAAKMYKNMGAKRIVLARECTLDKIKEIKENTGIEIETFVHGAMCVAVSGRCFMSHHLFNKSANTGECIQPCRREYEIYDPESDRSLLLGEDYVMSPKDLCTIEFIDQLIEAGIDSFKIEGRKRSPEYIAKVVSTYRKAIDYYFENKLTDEIKKEMFTELNKVYNRGFSSGFYFGEPSGDDYAIKYGSSASTKKIYIGKVVNYFKKTNIVHIKLIAGNLSVGDEVYIIGETTGVVENKIKNLVKEEKEISTGEKGDDLTFECNEIVRKGDEVYKIIYV